MIAERLHSAMWNSAAVLADFQDLPVAVLKASLPLAFSQVREDPLIDLAVLAELEPGARVLMIASGGDTAALIAAQARASSLTLVDVNPAQLALTRLKLHLLEHSAPEQRMALLGHTAMSAPARQRDLDAILSDLNLPVDVFGPHELVASRGPDRCGRYEMLFERLRAQLKPVGPELAALLFLADPAEQRRRVDRGTALGKALDGAFDEVMALEELVGLFGIEATQNPRQPFSRHFAGRLRWALGTFAARSNPFVLQMLAGFFLQVPYDWLNASLQGPMPRVEFVCSSAIQALEAAAEDSLDFIHLSNILDWLTPRAAAQSLGLAWRALRPGGRVVIRQLNSTLEIAGLEPRLCWLSEFAGALHAMDRSFFYTNLLIGTK